MRFSKGKYKPLGSSLGRNKFIVCRLETKCLDGIDAKRVLGVAVGDNTGEQRAPVVTEASCAQGGVTKSMSGEMVIPFHPPHTLNPVLSPHQEKGYSQPRASPTQDHWEGRGLTAQGKGWGSLA